MKKARNFETNNEIPILLLIDIKHGSNKNLAKRAMIQWVRENDWFAFQEFFLLTAS